VWVGVDNAWEQEKLEARKMPVNRADSHTSGARFVRRFYAISRLSLYCSADASFTTSTTLS
jgi:hypothetical protein